LNFQNLARSRTGDRQVCRVAHNSTPPLDAVPLGQLADRIVAFLRERQGDNLMLTTWRERNRHALREFWARPRRCARRQAGTREDAGAGRKADDITRPRERPGDIMSGTAQPKRGCSPPVARWTKASLTVIVSPTARNTTKPGRAGDRTVEPVLRAIVRSYEYEDWPRGRIVFDRSCDLFILYADRKLLRPATIARIETQFHLPAERIEVQSHFHYQSKETSSGLGT
jgi:hypothetical protein